VRDLWHRKTTGNSATVNNPSSDGGNLLTIEIPLEIYCTIEYTLVRGKKAGASPMKDRNPIKFGEPLKP